MLISFAVAAVPLEKNIFSNPVQISKVSCHIEYDNDRLKYDVVRLPSIPCDVSQRKIWHTHIRLNVNQNFINFAYAHN